ncbi:MAG: LCP family protein [Spirochaetia bacterium]|nr:LCP family protein [Spirochaetia bacterium]
MKNILKKWDRSFFLLGFIILLFIIGIIVLYALLHSDDVSDLVNKNESFSVLTVVHDEKTKEIVFSNIMFYSPLTHRASFLDIPSNSGELIPKLKRIDRIDSVYKPGHPAAYREAVENLINDKINFTVDMEIRDLGRLVDLLGGIEVFVMNPKDIPGEDNMIYSIPLGSYKIDGFKTPFYLSDCMESDLQNEVMAFVNDFYCQLGIQSDAFNRHIFKKLHSLMKTDWDRSSFNSFLGEMKLLKKDLTDYKLTYGKLEKLNDDTEVFFPQQNGSALKNLVRNINNAISNPELSRDNLLNINLEILNGTSVNGLARQTGELYKSFGYNIINIRNNENTDVEKTEIVDCVGNSEILKLLGDVIGCTNFRTIDDPVNQSESEILLPHYIIILGKDFDGKTCR